MNPNFKRAWDREIQEFDKLVYSGDIQCLKNWLHENYHIAAIQRDLKELLTEAERLMQVYETNIHMQRRVRSWLLNRLREHFTTIVFAREYMANVEPYEETVLYDFIEEWKKPLEDNKIFKVVIEIQAELSWLIRMVKCAVEIRWLLEEFLSREPVEDFDLSGWTREVEYAYSWFPPIPGKTDFEVWKENQGYITRPTYF